MKDKYLMAVEKNHIWISILFIFGSLFFRQWKMTFSVFLGVVIIMSSFWCLKKFILNWTQKTFSTTKLFFGLLAKYLLLMGILGGTIIYFDLHMIGLLIGISTLFMAIVMATIREGLMI